MDLIDTLEKYILENGDIRSKQNNIEWYEKRHADLHKEDINKLKLEIKGIVQTLLSELPELKALSLNLILYHNLGVNNQSRKNEVHRENCPGYVFHPLDVVEPFLSFNNASKRGGELIKIVHWDFHDGCDQCKPYVDVERLLNKLEPIKSSQPGEPFAYLYQ